MCVAFGGIGSVSFSGVNGRGAISVPGLEVGDVLYVIRTDVSPPAVASATDVELVVTTADQAYQYETGDLTSQTYTAIVFRAS